MRILLCSVLPILLSQLVLVCAQRHSPCPEVFSYEPRGQEEDRWYGVISLRSKDGDLDGVWLKVMLDRPAELLGNWFGEAISSDNQEYTIKNPKYRLEAGSPVPVRFFVKYNQATTMPSLTSIKLNGKIICSDGSSDSIETTTPQLHISQFKPNTNRPTRPSSRPSSGGETALSNNWAQERPRPQNNRETSSHSGANSNEDTSSHNYGQTQRPSRPQNNRETSSHSGSNSNEDTSSHNYGQTQRPSRPQNNRETSSHTGSSSNEDTSVHNYGHTQRPSRPQSHHESEEAIGFQNNHNSNGLSAEQSSSDNDFFPGDFALQRPNQARPPSRPSSISKRDVGCGRVAMKASPLISYGQNTSQGQWPWHAALYHTQGAQFMYTCGATLIGESHVLTAAHCVAKPQSNRPIDMRKLTVYLGKYSLKKFGEGTQDREVAQIFIHPDYNHSVYFNDIAILKLKQSVDVTNYVRPCCLWDDSTELEHVLNKLGTVVGWGFDEKRQISDILTQAQMPVVSTVDCIYSNRDFFSQFTFEKNYCAGFRNGTTVCNGDSGGGMVFPKTVNGQTVWRIRGIVSVGVALQGQGVCDPRHYIVFTDVAKHLKWIKEVMDQ